MNRYYIFFALAAIISFAKLGDAQTLDIIFIVCGVCAFLYNRHEANIYSLLIILVGIRATEVLLWMFLDVRNAYIAYPTHIVLDSIALAFITYRNKILAKIEFRTTGTITPHKYIYTNADYVLSFVYTSYIFIAVLALGEHIIRHLDDFGLPKEMAIPDLVVIHGLYSPLKLILNTFEYFAILATSHRIMQSGRFVTA